MVEERDAHLEGVEHAHAVALHQDVVRKVALYVHVLKPREVVRGRCPLVKGAEELEIAPFLGQRPQIGREQSIPLRPAPSGCEIAVVQDALKELMEETRLIAEETGIARHPDMPLASFVRAAAAAGNPRAQQLLARLKAALPPAL